MYCLVDLPLVTAHFRDYYPVCVKSTIAVANVIIIELYNRTFIVGLLGMMYKGI